MYGRYCRYVWGRYIGVWWGTGSAGIICKCECGGGVYNNYSHTDTGRIRSGYI